MILTADDVGEHLVAEHFGSRSIKFRHEADTDAGDGGLQGHTGVEQGKGASAYVDVFLLAFAISLFRM
jgi:hypothetical protein